MSPFGKRLSALHPVWIPAKRVEGGHLAANSQIPNLFLHPGSNPNFQKKRTAKKRSPPGAEPRVGEVSSPGR